MTWLKNSSVALFFLGLPLVGMLLTLYNLDTLSDSVQAIGTLWTAITLLFLGAPLVGLAILPSFFLGAMMGYYLNLPTALIISAFAIFFATYLGVSIGKLAGKNLLDDLVGIRPSWRKAWQNFTTQQAGTPKLTLTAIRLAPQMPFALTNLLCAGWPLQLNQIVFYSWIGLLPRTFFAVVLANSANSLRDILERKSTATEFTFSILILLVVSLTIYIGSKKASAKIAAETKTL